MNIVLLNAGDWCDASVAVLHDRRATHIREVLKAQVGDSLRVGLLGGACGQGQVEAIDADGVRLRVMLNSPPPARHPFDLVLALPRPKMLRRMLRQCAEFGVNHLHLIHSARVEKSYWQSPLLHPDRLNEALLAGLERARDTIAPVVHLHRRYRPFVEDGLPGLCAGRPCWIADIDAPISLAETPPGPAMVMIGPEGGFVPFEVQLAASVGARPVGLGERILSVDTALVKVLARPVVQRLAMGLTLALLLSPVVGAQAQMDPHQHHHHEPMPVMDHSAHMHDVGPAGSTYDLRWIDGMVQHHTGALRMSEFVFDIGAPGVGSLAKAIWRDQAQEIKAMGQWRKAWYPEAPIHPVALRPGGDPDAMADLIRMSPAQIEAMQMIASGPTRENRVTWFLEGMLQHHGGALIMAHDALNKSRNITIRRLARDIIVAQRREIIQLRRMLQNDGLNKPEYNAYDRFFSLN